VLGLGVWPGLLWRRPRYTDAVMDRASPTLGRDLHMSASITHQRLRRALSNVDFPAEKDHWHASSTVR
jgi:hypothetical protein